MQYYLGMNDTKGRFAEIKSFEQKTTRHEGCATSIIHEWRLKKAKKKIECN